jgi:putative DNA methylase
VRNPPRKKLIEVALPLESINTASAREKSIRHGHPSTLHLWWARRPLAAARAVIFAQMIDDPSSCPDLFPTDRAQEKERQRLFRIIDQLVQWENTANEKVLQQARDEIWQSWRRACAENVDHPSGKELFDRHKLPAFHDPFAGGGTLPLEAQRLGLEVYASDLNPVAVLISKAMVEIPPMFAGRPPVNPEAQRQRAQMDKSWRGAQGLADDVRYYGKWIRDEAEKRIGHLYPRIDITAEMAGERPDLKALVGRKLTVIAWLWARTVKSPNPAFAQIDVPLASTFVLSRMKGNEAYVEPVIEGSGYRFTVKRGKPSDVDAVQRGTKAGGSHSSFLCLMSGTPMPFDYLRTEGRAGRMGARLMAVVAEGERGRVYLSPTTAVEAVAHHATPEWIPETILPNNPRNFNTPIYGLDNYGKLFTPRQLVALGTFSDLVQEARTRVEHDALKAGMNADGSGTDRGQTATAYSDALAMYLAIVVDRVADYNSALCTWHVGGPTTGTKSRNTFSRQALPMTWDFAEVNPLSNQSGSIRNSIEYAAKSIEALGHCGSVGHASQGDARSVDVGRECIIGTDPPYYDNIGYADLSEFFYVWLRRSLKPIFPDLFATLAVPKAEELVATPYRHGSKEKAEAFFLNGMTHAMHRLAGHAHPAFPVTIYYAFKQSATENADGVFSTGWETFLDAVIRAGFSISGTWPIRTELTNRMIGAGANALASSIVLVCRPRTVGAPTATRREFLTALNAELPAALAHLQRGNIAPVDLAQAAIGPGMAVYTRYAKVLDADAKPLSVSEALALINQSLDDALAEQEGDFDSETRWALTWFEQVGFAEGEYGVAEQLSKAKNTSVDGMKEAGILASSRGKVRLFRPSELTGEWHRATDVRLTAWEMVHQLIRTLEVGGEGAAAVAVEKLGTKAEVARELAYRLYTICERKKRAAEALSYNGLVQSWPEITRLAREGGEPRTAQKRLFETEEE